MPRARKPTAREEADRAREALKASEARYRFLAEAIPVHIWTARPDGSLDYVTERVANYFGIPSAQLLVEGWRNVVHPDDLPVVAERWSAALASGERYEVKFRLRRYDGEYRWFLGRALPQRSADGTIVEWFGTNTDIHEQRAEQNTNE